MPSTDLPTSIQVPFSDREVEALNAFQLGIGPGLAGHPFTCRNRGDGRHGDEGGDVGVLIATRSGWVCPHCDYTQEWAHAAMAAPRAGGSAVLIAVMFQSREASVRAVLPGYQQLMERGATGADVMVCCLEKVLQAPEPNQDG